MKEMKEMKVIEVTQGWLDIHEIKIIDMMAIERLNRGMKLTALDINKLVYENK